MLNLLLNENFFIPRYYQQRAFKRYAHLFKGVVLDVGAGHKRYEKFINCDRYIPLELVRGTKWCDYYPEILGDAHWLPFKPNSIDCIICTDVLEHTACPWQVIIQFFVCLKKGGLLYITTPFYCYEHYVPLDFWRFTRYTLAHMLSNFRKVDIIRMGALMYFICSRISYTLFLISEKIFGNRLCMVLISPINLVLYLLTKLDKFNKRDVASFLVLARK